MALMAGGGAQMLMAALDKAAKSSRLIIISQLVQTAAEGSSGREHYLTGDPTMLEALRFQVGLELQDNMARQSGLARQPRPLMKPGSPGRSQVVIASVSDGRLWPD